MIVFISTTYMIREYYLYIPQVFWSFCSNIGNIAGSIAKFSSILQVLILSELLYEYVVWSAVFNLLFYYRLFGVRLLVYYCVPLLLSSRVSFIHSILHFILNKTKNMMFVAVVFNADNTDNMTVFCFIYMLLLKQI